MKPSVRALLSGALDYTGFIPPAIVRGNDVLGTYSRCRQDPQAWMLGNLVLPASNLMDLQPHANHEPIRLTLLAGSGNSMGEVLIGLQRDIGTVGKFRQTFGDAAQVQALDIKVQLLMPDFAPLVLNGLMQAIDKPTNAELAIFLEVGSPAGPRPAFTALIPLLGRNAARKPAHCRRPGLKVRCGGRRSSDILTSAELAFVITSCCEHDVPLKFTASIQAASSHDGAGRTKAHGFLNVLGASVLAHARKLSEQQVCAILDDEDAGHFVFDEDYFRWQDMSASVAEIEAARRAVVVAFDSCNLEERCEDLRALGLLT